MLDYVGEIPAQLAAKGMGTTRQAGAAGAASSSRHSTALAGTPLAAGATLSQQQHHHAGGSSFTGPWSVGSAVPTQRASDSSVEEGGEQSAAVGILPHSSHAGRGRQDEELLFPDSSGGGGGGGRGGGSSELDRVSSRRRLAGGIRSYGI